MLADQPRIPRRLLVSGHRQSGPIDGADIRWNMPLVNIRHSLHPCSIVVVEPAMDDQHNRQLYVDFVGDLCVILGHSDK